MTLRDYVLILARNWIVVVVTVAVGLVTAAIVAFATTTTYTASAQVLFTGHASTGGQDLAYAGNYVQNRMQTYQKLGSADSLARAVQNKLGTTESVQTLDDRTGIDVSQLSTVATVTATDSTGAGAARTANAMAQAFLEEVQALEGSNAAQPRTGKPGQATVEGRIIETATPPLSPAGPRIWLYLMAGLSVGLIVSIGVVAVREALKGEPEVAEAR